MYIEKIKGKLKPSYRTSITFNGKRMKSPVFERKTDCRLWYDQKKTELLQLKLHGTESSYYSNKTIDEYSQQWLRTKTAQGLASSTLQNYERYLNVHILPFFKGRLVRDIRKQDVEEFQIHLRKKHNPKGTNLIIGALKNLFSEAIKEGLLLKNPCLHIKSISSDCAEEVYWTREEINLFLNASAQHELYALFVVALNTGMRRGELAALKWDRVDFANKSIVVSRTRDYRGLKERSKTKIKRVIPMNDVVRLTLVDLYQNRIAGEDLVFLKSNGKPIDPHHLYRDFSSVQRKAGLTRRIRFHDLRHTFASQFVMGGGNLYDLQKILGHTKVDMTSRYAHLSKEWLQRAIGVFSVGSPRTNPPEVENVVLLYRQTDNTEQMTQNRPKETELESENRLFLEGESDIKIRNGAQ